MLHGILQRDCTLADWFKINSSAAAVCVATSNQFVSNYRVSAEEK